MSEYKAPERYPKHGLKLFLGGSIEMGKAEKWQEKVVAHLEENGYNDVIILNPRRDDWDSTWEQSPLPGSKFYEQVEWELKAQESSTIICYYFAKDTMSPITLLELGLYGCRDDKDVIVYVDKDYLRHGNVVMTCKMYGINYTESYEDFLTDIEIAIEDKR